MKKVHFLLLAALLFLLASCDNTKKVGVTLPSFDRMHVHVAGYTTNAAGIQIAAVWYNGRETVLSDGTMDAMPFAVTTVGRDVYVAGNETVGQNDTRAVVWVNGTKKEVLPGGSSAFGLFVNRDTTYAAGISGQDASKKTPVLWIKDSLVNLPTDTGNAVASSVWVAEKIVKVEPEKQIRETRKDKTRIVKMIYVTGTEYDDAGSSRAVLWTNGIKKTLESNGGNSVAVNLLIQDTTVYVTGYLDTRSPAGCLPVLWKNDTLKPISGPGEIFPNSIFVRGKDVYVGGYTPSLTNYIAAFWENGSARTLAGVTPDKDSGVTAICADNIDYYAAGYVGNKAVLWLQGRCYDLTSGKSEARATAICLAK